jgi:tetratricopeptide (TPR) repeat protein
MSLQMRANILANRSDWAGDATRDADESLEIFRGLGDAWGTAEALAARGEAHERAGAYELAAADYEAAIEHAERLGARAQMAILKARLGSALLESGELERGEALLREVVETQNGAHNDAMPAGRLFLAGWLGITGRTEEAREHVVRLRQDFNAASFALFDGFILGVEAWLDTVDERYEEALSKTRQALKRADDALARTIMPHLHALCLTLGAAVLAGHDGGRRARDAARLLGAADALLPSGHVAGFSERATRDHAVTLVRAALGEAEYEAAYAEGDGLSPEEAAALI